MTRVPVFGSVAALTMVLAACGTRPPEDAGADIGVADTGPSDSGSAADILDGSDDTLQDVEIVDTDVRVDAGEDPSVDDAMDQPADVPEVCGIEVRCHLADGAELTGDAQLAFGSVPSDATCTVTGGEEGERFRWQLMERDTGPVTSVSEPATNFPFFAPRPGRFEVVARSGACEGVSAEFAVVPGDDPLLTLSWTGGGHAAELDLHIFRDPDACWFHPEEHFSLVAPSPNLDWGVEGVRADDPNGVTFDWRQSPGTETVSWGHIGEGESWTVRAHAPIDEVGSSMVASVTYYRAGAAVVATQWEVQPGAVWSALRISNDAEEILGTVVTERPEACGELQCGDRPWRPEECNGLDDDCDGDIDEAHQVCLNAPGGTSIGRCTQDTDGEYFCRL